MRALVKTRPAYGLELLDVADPEPGPREVVIRVGAAKVCGSDIGRYEWTRNYARGAAKDMVDDLPRILGHEYAGTIVSAGREVRSLAVGDRIAVRAMLNCGRCDACQRGDVNICADRRTLGVHRDGGYAELAVVPETNATPLPDEVSFELGAAITSFATSTHAVSQSGLEPGDALLIWGAGAIGLGAMLAARQRGAGDVFIADRSPERLRLAERMGAIAVDVAHGALSEVLLDLVGRRRVAAAIEAAGIPEAVAATLPILKKGGAMVLIGNMAEPSRIDLMPLIMDQQRLLGSRSKSIASWSTAVRTIERSGYEAILPPTVPMERALDAFEAAASGARGPFSILPND